MNSIASFSYGLAGASFIVLAILLLTRWRGRHGPMLAVSIVLTALWAGAIAWEAGHGRPWSVWTDTLEILRNAGWSAFLILMLGNYRDPASRLPFQLRPAPLIAAVFYLLFLVATVIGRMDLMLVNHIGFMPNVGARVCLAVFGMLLVEQVYRNKTAQERWGIKFACLGICAMFAYDFYMYSHTMLFHEVSEDIWAARGVINALTVPLIGMSVARTKSWTSPLALSRNVMFHSAALFGSAIYLLAMGSAGYYLKYFGGSWGAVMQVTFLFGALLLLAGVLFSGTFRSWLKVFISKHFYTYNYDYREEWMRFTRILSEQGPGLGDRAIQAVAALVESPGGVLWQRGETGQFEPVAKWQARAPAATESPDSAFCQFLESTQWVIDLHEFSEAPDKYEGLMLPGWLKVSSSSRNWLVVPFMMHGKLFGFLVLHKSRSPVTLNWEVFDLLEIAGSQAASYLSQQDAANALMVARQFESFNRMSTFVVHDLKNLVSQLSLMNANAVKHRDNPEFQADMLETVDYSVQKMRLMLQKLSRSEATEAPRALTVDQVVRQAVALKAAFEPRPELRVETAGLAIVADRERLERVVGHLIQNAIEATPKEGSVTITVGQKDDSVRIEIADTGEGMTDEFIRERLYKPFESTKSAGMGIGVFESREYITELGGTLDVFSTPALGTTFTVILPLQQRAAMPAAQAA